MWKYDLCGLSWFQVYGSLITPLTIHNIYYATKVDGARCVRKYLSPLFERWFLRGLRLLTKFVYRCLENCLSDYIVYWYCLLIKMDCFSRLVAVRAMTRTAGGGAKPHRWATGGISKNLLACSPLARRSAKQALGGIRKNILATHFVRGSGLCAVLHPCSVIASVSVSEPKQSIWLINPS